MSLGYLCEGNNRLAKKKKANVNILQMIQLNHLRLNWRIPSFNHILNSTSHYWPQYSRRARGVSSVTLWVRLIKTVSFWGSEYSWQPSVLLKKTTFCFSGRSAAGLFSPQGPCVYVSRDMEKLCSNSHAWSLICCHKRPLIHFML